MWLLVERWLSCSFERRADATTKRRNRARRLVVHELLSPPASPPCHPSPAHASPDPRPARRSPRRPPLRSLPPLGRSPPLRRTDDRHRPREAAPSGGGWHFILLLGGDGGGRAQRPHAPGCALRGCVISLPLWTEQGSAERAVGPSADSITQGAWRPGGTGATLADAWQRKLCVLFLSRSACPTPAGADRLVSVQGRRQSRILGCVPT